jgi:hypothetical protein
MSNAFSNVIQFAATAAQESGNIFDGAPAEAVTGSGGGFIDTCVDWVSENRNLVIGAGAVAGAAAGAYFAYPWLRDKFSESKNNQPQPAQASAQKKPDAPAETPAETPAPTAEEVQENLRRATEAAQEHLKKAGGGKK